MVVGLGGSTRRSSRALEALRIALQGAHRGGAEILLLDIRELALPILDADRPDFDQDNVRSLLAAVRRCDALIVSSPVYQQTVSGAVKNALDYLFILEQEEPAGLYGKVVGLVSVSASRPGVGASLAMQTACNGLGAWVLPESVNLDGASFDYENAVCDVFARDRLSALGRRVVAAAVARQAADRVGVAAEHLPTPDGTFGRDV
jgi:FMN reductase